ncbi:MAG: hypothetical protein DRO89_03400 [Candidatus Altiarchaeales archaeon]|nr:MAG: hypothetical protein DRO89_03400 [Candidatus Altiarchaeales archaeon]
MVVVTGMVVVVLVVVTLVVVVVEVVVVVGEVVVVVVVVLVVVVVVVVVVVDGSQYITERLTSWLRYPDLVNFISYSPVSAGIKDALPSESVRISPTEIPPR